MTARSAYIHVPFCRHRCAYCNFTVVADRKDLEAAYLAAVETELRGLVHPQPVDTVFVGGGTPTELTTGGLKKLCLLIDKWFPRTRENAETTFEANPDGLDVDRVAILATHGVNRLSLGVQSFSDDKLKRLDRRHRAEEIHEAINLARPHFQSISLDMIFAAPNESIEDWENDLSAALAWRPDHLSTYGLTVERGTLFWNRRHKGQLTEIGENLQRRMYVIAIDRLTTAGYEHYEVSNFAKPGFRCQHNETYWLGKEYFAIGPGASRFIDGRRETNHRSTSTYIRRMAAGESPVAASEVISNEELSRERLVFGMRRLEGIHVADFDRDNTFSVEQLVGHTLPQLMAESLVEEINGRLRLTRKGLLVSDSIWPEFL